MPDLRPGGFGSRPAAPSRTAPLVVCHAVALLPTPPSQPGDLLTQSLQFLPQLGTLTTIVLTLLRVHERGDYQSSTKMCKFKSVINYELTAFFPLRGAKAAGEMMVVGRAVNGWARGFRPDEARSAQMDEIIQDARTCSLRGRTCPLLWVTDDWGVRGFTCWACGKNFEENPQLCPSCAKGPIKKRYSTARSAFWREVKLLVNAWNIADVDKPEWPSHLIWTNLYKVSPVNGGNPTGHLQKVQRDLVHRRTSGRRSRTGIHVESYSSQDSNGPNHLSEMSDQSTTRPMRSPERFVQVGSMCPLVLRRFLTQLRPTRKESQG